MAKNSHRVYSPRGSEEMKINTPPSRVVVSALVERTVNGERRILIQTRHKPITSPSYLDTIEIPAGGVNAYENIFDALKREVKEETGLIVTKIVNGCSSKVLENRPGDKSMVFQPFICQQVTQTKGGLPWYGFVFLCQAKGKLHKNQEATNHKWITIQQLKELLKNHPQDIFPLQYAALKYYLLARRNAPVEQ